MTPEQIQQLENLEPKGDDSYCDGYYQALEDIVAILTDKEQG